MTVVLIASAGLALGGPLLAACLVSALVFRSRSKRRPRPHPIRPVLLVMIVELRAGRSTLAALHEAATSFPDNPQLVLASRVASVRGVAAAIAQCQGPVRSLLAQLARAQRSGAPVADVVRSLLESDIAAERARRMEKARSLPVRLMVPIALMVLPGLVLLIYAPSLLRTLADLSAPFS
jgi:Flp pilus assembly protein TadB